MASNGNIRELEEEIKHYCEERDWDKFHGAKDLAIGISTEAAELLEHFRFKSETEVEKMFKNKEKRDEIAEEMADVLYFLLRLSQKYDIDVANELKKKLEKNRKRYPVEKAKGSNKKYTELME
ncbi:MAG: nucleotide pyrophosphohydrolase [Candidatus Micrarchaeia archaeon]